MICLLDTSSWYFFSLFFSSPGNFSWHTRHTGFKSNSKNLVLEQNKFYLLSKSLSLHNNFYFIIRILFTFNLNRLPLLYCYTGRVSFMNRLSYFFVTLASKNLFSILITIWQINLYNSYFKTNNTWYFFYVLISQTITINTCTVHI